MSFAACSGEDGDGNGDAAAMLRGTYNNAQAIPAPIDEAHCEILVEGTGVVDMETDYLPHVVMCENGGANLEALKAQAIAARSVAYYYVEKHGSVCDSQGCQVYSCASEPSQEVYEAVAATSGIYLSHSDTLTYSFYVAGDNGTAPPECIGQGGGTEGFVTYNQGLSGFDVEQTTLGWVFEPGEVGYGQNRGCMSQWGARCLENHNGYDYDAILRFYYGADINVVQAQGACVEGGDEDSSTGGGETTTEDEGEPAPEDDGETTTEDSGDATTEDCPIGAEGCPCTMGGGCDPGLVCEDGICGPATDEGADGGDTGLGDEDDGGGDDELGDEGPGGGFGADAFELDEAGCACAAEPSFGRERDRDRRALPWLALLLLGAPLRARSRARRAKAALGSARP